MFKGQFRETDSHEYLQYRYWNTGGYGIIIVASVTKRIDWSAYIGADDPWSEEDCREKALKEGVKLTEKEARFFFPDIDMRYRH